MMWYLDANVTNFGVPLANSSVLAWDVNSALKGNQTTNSNGSARMTLLEYTNVNNTQITYYSNYTVNATYALSTAISQSVNMSTNRQLSFNMLGTQLNSCANLTSENTTYSLTGNVSSTGTCFNVLAKNVTLDCQGYEINYSYSGTVAVMG